MGLGVFDFELGILVSRLSATVAASSGNGREGARSWGDVAHPREVVRGSDFLARFILKNKATKSLNGTERVCGVTKQKRELIFDTLGCSSLFTRIDGFEIVHNMGSLLASFVAQICKVHLGSVHRALSYGFQYLSDEELYVPLCVILTSLFDVIHIPSDLVQYYTKMMAHPDERDTNRKGSPYYLAISVRILIKNRFPNFEIHWGRKIVCR
ncbi:hypothetical protein ACFE04_029848 [Oxalis oulophora]